MLISGDHPVNFRGFVELFFVLTRQTRPSPWDGILLTRLEFELWEDGRREEDVHDYYLRTVMQSSSGGGRAFFLSR